MIIRNEYGFPIIDNNEKSRYAPSIEPPAPTPFGRDRLSAAQAIAEAARRRNFSAPCECKMCVTTRNLPSVMRILAKWKPMDAA